MAIQWIIKSLHCKSMDGDVFCPVVDEQRRRNCTIHRPRHSSASSTPTSTSTSTSSTSKTSLHHSSTHTPPQPTSKRRLSANKSKSQPQTTRFTTAAAKTLFPSLTDLPQGHPSRNVVELIFRSRWGDKDDDFPGQVEMVFKVHNLTRTLARFEEYREHVKSRARAALDGDVHARSVADGNEVMRFYCLGGGAAYYETGGGWGLHSGKEEAAVCTYSGSGAAHENAGGGGGGRRAMLVCRVIAGRVWKGAGCGTRVGYESRSTETGGELYVFDARAILPCFLIIYRHKPH